MTEEAGGITPTVAAPGLSITYRPLDEIIPNPQNSRTHSQGQIAVMERSLAQFGWTTPMALADGMLIYGHARLQAAKNLRARGVAIRWNADPAMGPTVDLSHLSKSERRAYMVADNRIAELAGWDADVLRTETAYLSEEGFDVSLTGFDEGALLALIGGGGGQQSSSAGTPANPVRVSLGDRFGVPPFTVLSARDGVWQARKRAWLALGMRSELGRGGNLLSLSWLSRLVFASGMTAEKAKAAATAAKDKATQEGRAFDVEAFIAEHAAMRQRRLEGKA